MGPRFGAPRPKHSFMALGSGETAPPLHRLQALAVLLRKMMRAVFRAARSVVERCAVVCLSAAAAVALTLLVGADGGHGPCLPFCLAVVVSAWYGAIGQGVVAALLSALFLEHFLNIPLSKADFNSEDFKLAAVFALVSFAASWLSISRGRTLRGPGETHRTFGKIRRG